MIRTIWGDPERFKKSYFPEELKGYYLAGDGAVRSVDRGYFRITGRIDDVLNVSGHRMGTMEIESALVGKTDLVAEAAVVGRPDDLTGEAIVAFVVLKRSRPTGDEAKAIAKVLRDWVGKEIGPIAKPKDIRLVTTCPRPARARSCAACCARSPKVKPSPRTPPPWRTRPSWINCLKTIDAVNMPERRKAFRQQKTR
jgi:acetyl-CoA synthetase